MDSGYNVITRENMEGYLSEAASSEEEGVEDEHIRGTFTERDDQELGDSRERVVLANSAGDFMPPSQTN